MPGGFSLRVEGLEAFTQRIKSAPEKIKTEGAELIDEVAKGIENDAKSAAPVNYGYLKSTISQNPPSNEGLLSGVTVGADYGAYVEFGTGTHVDVPDDPEGLPEYALQFKGGKEIPGMIARPYLFPAVRTWTPVFIKRMEKILNEL